MQSIMAACPSAHNAPPAASSGSTRPPTGCIIRKLEAVPSKAMAASPRMRLSPSMSTDRKLELVWDWGFAVAAVNILGSMVLCVAFDDRAMFGIDCVILAGYVVAWVMGKPGLN